MDTDEESSRTLSVKEPSWLQPYCSWCRKIFENMNEYMKHLQSRLHDFHVKISHYDRNQIHPLGWIMPRCGDHVRIHWGRYHNAVGQVMCVNRTKSTLDIYIYSMNEEIIAKNIPFYAVLKVRDGV
ncbi:unnamed protein product, partial [Hymenolepis diminuta]